MIAVSPRTEGACAVYRQLGALALVCADAPFYEDVGSGPVVVLVHAGIADSRMWDTQVASFAEAFRVVRYDIAGYGRSPLAGGPFSYSRDLIELLDELERRLPCTRTRS
jgi:pimeloyl-ACP methyl ester carboxylesterase